MAGVSFIALGSLHSCAVLVGGDLKCWGYNGQGQLGLGDTAHRYTPVSVSVGSGELFTSSGRKRLDLLPQVESESYHATAAGRAPRETWLRLELVGGVCWLATLWLARVAQRGWLKREGTTLEEGGQVFQRREMRQGWRTVVVPAR